MWKNDYSCADAQVALQLTPYSGLLLKLALILLRNIKVVSPDAKLAVSVSRARCAASVTRRKVRSPAVSQVPLPTSSSSPNSGTDGSASVLEQDRLSAEYAIALR